MRRVLAVVWAILACVAGPLAAQEFTTLKGHGGPIMALAVSPEGNVASASFDNSVGLWSGQEPHWLEGHDAAVSAVAFGPGDVLVSGGDDFAVRLWTPDTRVLGHHEGKVSALAVSPDGQHVVSGSWDGSIQLWPVAASGQGLLIDRPGSGVNTLGFSADGAYLYAGTTDGALIRYDLVGGSAPFPMVQHGFGINELVVGTGWVAYGAVDGGTRVVDAQTGDAIADFTLDRRPILAMDWHAETGQIAVGDGQGYIMMLDTNAWRIVSDTRATRQGPVWALAFSTDGAIIHAGGLDDVVYAWPVATLDQFGESMGQTERAFLRDPATMSNGERQFMRKCSICHALTDAPSRKAGPSLFGVFGRAAGSVDGYAYSDTLSGSPIVWDDDTIDALFDQGPDHYIPGSKMPMQVITKPQDRADLIAFMKEATGAAEAGEN
ncbi:c-type cytochrome [Cognatishimia sp. F0-27]|uniref:c-type cytochrome n=1 Tax=Cognatishimia sp. F0-27 TaxID=2816855 RepID=UPI001D0CDB14|nr:c-type cytochrome [Cognatishimia sp. F0-27]MCC1492939.1 c-type cytochrome [Cognatishimia sp. F0-27]